MYAYIYQQLPGATSAEIAFFNRPTISAGSRHSTVLMGFLHFELSDLRSGARLGEVQAVPITSLTGGCLAPNLGVASKRARSQR
jgi:hypothetical protein